MIPYCALRHCGAFSIFTIVIALFLAACSGSSVPIVGVVTDMYTNKPIVAATVALGNQTLATDTTGHFEIARWSKRDTLKISAEGYETQHISLGSHPQLTNPQPLTVTLDPITLRPNALSGVVTDSYTDKPLAGVIVRAGETISTTTNAVGQYTLMDVPETFTLMVSTPDYAAITQDVSRETTKNIALRSTILTGVVQDSYTEQPLSGVVVTVGNSSVKTDDKGHYRLMDVPEEIALRVNLEGYAAFEQTLKKTTAFDVSLRPNTLKRSLIDAVSKEPVRNATIIASESLTTEAVAFTRIDNSTDGSFTLEGMPAKGYLQVLAPGYRKAVIDLKSNAISATIALEPLVIKSLYVTSAVASVPDLLKEYFDLIDRTELNAIVIDLKSDLRDDLGLVYYDSHAPLVKELDTAKPIMDVKEILAEAKRRNIYTIARIHIFSHDNVLADAKPEWAVRDRKTGGVFADYPTSTIRYAWLDPWNQHVWEYNIQLAVEAALLGFDEINYDYIRFPSLEFSAEDKERVQFSRPEEEDTSEERFKNIAAMLERSQRAINGAGAFLSIDVFGYTTWRPDKLIGQNLQLMSQHTDYVCPMVYPSHYLDGELGFDNPAAHPYEIVLDSLQKGAKQVEGNRALLRPWIQDFTLVWVPKSRIVEYGPAQVRAQIKAVNDFGKASGWILYDSANDYTEEALNPAKENNE